MRAYYRKKALKPSKPHLELLSELFGCDISPYPAHLATLNLAAREINEEANYPRVTRKDFLRFRPDQEFCRLPCQNGSGEISVHLPLLDAAVANPPYVRQEKIEKKDKEHAKKVLEAAWPGLHISGRSDLHIYFWAAAARLLKSDGYFGFLTSSSWLDVEYGFHLQAWILQHFQLIAIMESNAEPWFPDARVKTCVAIMRRCDDAAMRMSAQVKFVQFKKPLGEIIGAPPGEGAERQLAMDRLRAEIESATADRSDERMRIIVKAQSDLWEAGVRAGRIVGSTGLLTSAESPDEDAESEADAEEDASEPEPIVTGSYAAGKWGRYVRAPDFYFTIMREFGAGFAPLGELVTVRFGVKSGCDAFFMPRDISRDALERFADPREFKREYGVDRDSIANGHFKIIKAGDGSVHLIETEFLRSEIHSLMNVDRAIVRSGEFDRVVLLVDKPLSSLEKKYVSKYLRYGETHSFDSDKSKAVPVPERSTVKAREPWFNLTKLVKPGFGLWPKAQQYRHIVPANPDRLICNCNLYDMAPKELSRRQEQTLIAVLNSTLVALWKTFYGRFAGTEGNLKTEVVDVNLLDVPNPKGVSESIAAKLAGALESMQSRSIGRLVEEQLMDCHSPERARKIAEGPLVLSNELTQADRRTLDEATFEMLGVSDPVRRKTLVDQLHAETARHFRQIRVVEIQKMEQRRKSANRHFSTDELSTDLWDAAELVDLTPFRDWLAHQPAATAGAIIAALSGISLKSCQDV